MRMGTFSVNRFNTQPPEGGWTRAQWLLSMPPVSTHSRLKAAGFIQYHIFCRVAVSTHSRLKAAGAVHWFDDFLKKVSTHSRLKAAG